MVTEVSIMVALGRHHLGGDVREPFEELEVFYILIWIVFPRINSYTCKNLSYIRDLYTFVVGRIMPPQRCSHPNPQNL